MPIFRVLSSVRICSSMLCDFLFYISTARILSVLSKVMFRDWFRKLCYTAKQRRYRSRIYWAIALHRTDMNLIFIRLRGARGQEAGLEEERANRGKKYPKRICANVWSKHSKWSYFNERCMWGIKCNRLSQALLNNIFFQSLRAHCC